jgi:excinuclease ABC subunit A
LSGGEVERVNLTSCLGTGLVDTLFVLDEPSVGLHARDIDRLVAILRRLTEQGNTVVVVEHDESVMRAADWIVEIGPRPGSDGGELTYAGPAAGLWSHPASITGAYLSGRETIQPPARRRPVEEADPHRWLTIERATKHNIRELSLRLPLERFVAFAGVSGSGKSTLLNNIIYQGLMAAAGKAVDDPAEVARIDAAGGFSEIVLVDQGPISRTPRSNAVLFAEAWDPIRNLFAGTDEARAAGWTAQMFSFNAGAGVVPTARGGRRAHRDAVHGHLYVKGQLRKPPLRPDHWP